MAALSRPLTPGVTIARGLLRVTGMTLLDLDQLLSTTRAVRRRLDFMLAARARSLGTAWTSMHLARERDVAEVRGLGYETLAQAVQTPVAYTKGTDFQPAGRPAPDEVIRWI